MAKRSCSTARSISPPVACSPTRIRRSWTSRAAPTPRSAATSACVSRAEARLLFFGALFGVLPAFFVGFAQARFDALLHFGVIREQLLPVRDALLPLVCRRRIGLGARLLLRELRVSAPAIGRV